VDSSQPPPNVKIMTGVPWIIDEFPRQLRPVGSEGEIFGSDSNRKRPARKQNPKDLPTINERPSHMKSPLSQRFDAAAASSSSTDLRSEGHRSLSNDDASSIDDDRLDGGPRKVHKNQINALAKMLSALRR